MRARTIKGSVSPARASGGLGNACNVSQWCRLRDELTYARTCPVKRGEASENASETQWC